MEHLRIARICCALALLPAAVASQPGGEPTSGVDKALAATRAHYESARQAVLVGDETPTAATPPAGVDFDAEAPLARLARAVSAELQRLEVELRRALRAARTRLAGQPAAYAAERMQLMVANNARRRALHTQLAATWREVRGGQPR